MDSTSERLRALRGKTLQSAVAQETGISRSSLSQYENGMRPPLDAMIALANYYHVTLDYLAGLSSEKRLDAGQLQSRFAALTKLESSAPTASDISDLLDAMIRYCHAGMPCHTIPLNVWKGFIAGLTDALNAAVAGDVGELVDKTNAATVAVLEVTKMPAAYYERLREKVQK